MLPASSHITHPVKPSALGPSFGSIVRYRTRSNDVLEGQLRISVEDEASGRSIWHTERVLTEHEIVESVRGTSSKSLKWTIHRPKSGWYIRLRSPIFPPRSFVPLVPCDPSEGDPTVGILAFTCQTNIDMTPPPPAYPSPSLESLIHPAARGSIASDHSYPPPPLSPIQSPPPEEAPFNSHHQGSSVPDAIPPSGRSSSTSTLSTTSRSPPPPFGASQSQRHPAPLTTASPQVHSELTRFLLAPVSPPKSNRLSFLPSAVSSSFMGRRKSFVIRTQSIPPVLTFTDTTALLIGTGVASGIIELDHGVARALGVEPSWWIAVALAYVEFLDERDAYLAAANG